MDCLDAQRALSLMADGNLAPEAIGSLEEHLGSCGECARFARTVEAVQSHFKDLPRPAAPDGLTAAVMARMVEPGARLLLLKPLLSLTAAAAAVLFILTGSASLLLKDTPGEAPDEVRPSLTADGDLTWIMEELARESAPRIGTEEKK